MARTNVNFELQESASHDEDNDDDDNRSHDAETNNHDDVTAASSSSDVDNCSADSHSDGPAAAAAVDAQDAAAATPGTETKPTTVDMTALLAKLDTLREEHYSALGKARTCRNSRVFIIVYSIVVLVTSALSSYLFTVLKDVERRYQLTYFETEFMQDADKISIVVSLILTSYYGNMMHKPHALMSGCLLYAFGALLAAVPYWSLGARKSYSLSGIQRYLDSGLCQGGRDSTPTNSSSSSVNEPVTYSEQCEYLPASLHSGENEAAFSMLCLAQIVMGLARAFVLPLGLVYADEAGKKPETVIYIGN